MPMTFFQGYSDVGVVKLKVVFSLYALIRLSSNCVWLMDKIMHKMFFMTGVYLIEITDVFPVYSQYPYLHVDIFSETLKF